MNRFRYLLPLLFPIFLSAQTLTHMEFRDQPVRDILMVLAESTGSSILADETVSGSATYFFKDMELEETLDQFLLPLGYYYTKQNGTYHVSRMRFSMEEGLISFQAEKADWELVIRRLSREAGITILHDALPREKVSVNFRRGELAALLEILIKPFSQFRLEAGDNYFYIRKTIADTPYPSTHDPDLFLLRDGLYSADFKQVRFRTALDALMGLQGAEFAFLGRHDDVIEHFHHRNRSFEEMLALLLEQGSSDYQLRRGIYYILDLDRQDILKRYVTTLYLPLEHLAADQLSSLVPGVLGSSGVMKINRENNGVILTGTLNEIAPLESFIRQVDRPLGNRSYRRYDLQHLTVEECRNRLDGIFSGVPLTALGDKAFVTVLSDEKQKALADYLGLIDRPVVTFPVELSYLKWEILKDNLPPGIDPNQIHPTGDPTLLFFSGSSGQYESLLSHLERMDRPIPQIRYEILVLEIEDSRDLDLDSGHSAMPTGPGESLGFSGTLEGLASLTFDVVNQFGYLFAAKLSLELRENRSRVLTDTTLFGLSGEDIRLQNTNTSRHATTAVDADTGETEVTGFREITSGLIVKIGGWVSGDGMITIDVESTISSQNSSSAGDGSIPSTSEKIINTRVRSQSGAPIILSGLKQRKAVTEIRKVPLLGDIPLAGLLFQKRSETIKNSEFLITLVPYRETEDSPLIDPYQSAYDRFCRRN